MTTTFKGSFKEIAAEFAGRVIIKRYGKNNDKSLTFMPVSPVPSGMRCECGNNEWNATNFENLVHVCPSRIMEVEVTDFTATQA